MLISQLCHVYLVVVLRLVTVESTSNTKYSRSDNIADSAHFREIAADGAASSGWKWSEVKW